MMKINSFLEKPINKFILWFLIGLMIILVGISSVKADSLFNNNTIHFYNNNGSSYNDVGTSYIDQTGESWSNLTTVAGSYGGLVAIQLSSPLIQGHIYTLFLNVGAESNGGQTRLSSKNCLGIGGNYDTSNTSYLNCEITPKFSDYAVSTQDKSRGIYYTFIANKNGIILSVPYTSQYTCNGCRNYSYGYTLQDNGDSSVLTQAQINTIINNQSSTITNSINSSEQNITNNFNEKIDDTFNSCSGSQTNLFSGISWVNGYIRNDGTVGSTATSNTLSDYISVTSDTKYNITANTSFYNIAYALFDSNKNRLSSQDNYNTSKVSLNTGNASYIRIWFNYNNSTNTLNTINNYDVNFNDYICQSKLDQQTSAINDVNDTLNNDNVDSSNATDTLSNLSNSVASNSVISDLLLLPVRLFQNIVNSINGSCSPFNLGTLYNTNLSLPCINIPGLIGDTLWTVIDILFCGSFILVIRKKFVDIFENLSELKNGGNAVE